MAYENNEKKWKAFTAKEFVLVKEGLIFDVRATRGNDYYIQLLKVVKDLTTMDMTGIRYFFTKKTLISL